MNAYKVTFKYSDFVYCTNIAKADTPERVREHYARYEWVVVKEATPYDIEEATRKGMPIITI